MLLSILAILAWFGAAEPLPTRTFDFAYNATITGLKPGQTARVWLPVPPANEDQRVTLLDRKTPGRARETREQEYGNSILYVEAMADAQGEIRISNTYRVMRNTIRADAREAAANRRFLQPDRRVPIDGKPLTLLSGKNLPTDPAEKARAIYDLVLHHMRYSKEGTGWGQGDAVWACDSRFGNCSDFHSLFISLARAQKIPARFEMGFPLPAARGEGTIAGYHCWARFHLADKGWIPIDISEASKQPAKKDFFFGTLDPDRIVLSLGRDITLEPQQAGPSLNFFIYPYVEVDGKACPAEQIRTEIRYKDAKP